MKQLSTFLPPERTLMGPGPSDVSPRILNAMARPTLGHLDPLFIELMDETKSLLQYAFQTENALTMPISAPALPAWKRALLTWLNLVIKYWFA